MTPCLVDSRPSCHHCRVILESAVARGFRWSYVAAGLFACVLITVVDVSADRVVLIPLLVLAPLVAAGGSSRGAFAVAVVAATDSVVLGWPDNISLSRRHWVGIATTVLGGALAVWVAKTREARDRQLAESMPILRRADRLKAALATGRMGEWSWDRITGSVSWDSNTAMLFGVEGSSFGGTFEEWIGHLDERDRPMVELAVANGVERREPFRFDHRSTWPDGSVHWIEGIGDVIVDEKTNEVIGAFGLAIDIDERHREIEERTRLLDLELRQRQRVEYLAQVNDVLAYSVDAAEIVKRVTESVVPKLAEWCSIVIAIDRRRDRPTITVAHRDPDKLKWADQIQRDYPYDPDAPWGAARVIRTGRREYVASVDPVVFSLPGGDVLQELGLESVITVPLIGALGILGSMQLIRCDGRPPFEPTEIELIEELAARVGGALNSAILFDRQTRGRAALDTLQQVSGRIASVATTDKIVHAVLAYGSSGINADAGVVFLFDDDGELVVKEATVRAEAATRDAERDVALQSIDTGSVAVVERVSGRKVWSAVGVPLRIMNRTVGSLVFTFNEYRDFSPEELSMLVTLGSRCAGALERASLYERDRDIALTFQHRLMPGLPHTPEWIAIAAGYRPASGLAIGGDWYQVLEAGGGRVAAVVGDAVGHGLAAAAAMGQLRASIATAVANDAEPNHAIAAVDLFAVQGADTIGASLAYVLFDPDGHARYVSAGHVPVVLAPADGDSVLLEGGRRPLLGFRAPDEHNLTADFVFATGDIVVMFTDGLVERRGESIDDGLKRLLVAVDETRDLSPKVMCSVLLDRLTDGYDADDDIALLVIKRN
jgi:GAF domain-containing protein/PAS domain-containing protein